TAQRRILRSLAIAASLRHLDVHLTHAKKSRPIPIRAGEGSGDAGKALIGAAVPQKAIFGDGNVVGCTLPFSHQNRSAARKWSGYGCGRLGWIAAEHLVKQPRQLLGDWFAEATVSAFLPRIGDAERKNVTTQRRRRSLAKFLSPEYPQLAAG